jgi:hypothetical protein
MWVARHTNAGPTTSDRMCCAHGCAIVRFGSTVDTSDTFVLSSVDMISTAVLEELAGSYGIRNFMSAMSASSLKVSMSDPPKSRTLRAMVLCFCCLPAARALGWLIPASGSLPPDRGGISRARWLT